MVPRGVQTGDVNTARTEAIRVFGPEVVRRGPYQVIYTDPPWPSTHTITKGWIGNLKARPYRTMTAKALLELPVRLLAADAAFMVMWSTWSHLDLAMRVIEAWGFEYCSGMPWLKVTKAGRPHFGMGIWFRHCTEPLLVAKRGDTRPLVGAEPGQTGNPKPAREGLIEAPRGKHSRKPLEVYGWIEAKMPGPRIELFARERRRGWMSWGDQLPPPPAAGH